MPNAAQRLCPGQCGTLVTRGRCPACAERLRVSQVPRKREHEMKRGSSWSRGYRTAWRRFRKVTFPAMLERVGLLPMCGVVLPDGPQTSDSRCKAEGMFVSYRLELDHEPPLRPEERDDDVKVCDPKRVQYLCYACHGVKTARQRVQGGYENSSMGAH